MINITTKSSFKASLKGGLPLRYDFIWIQPSIEELMTYPEALKRTLIFSNTSTKISFFFVAEFTGRFVATEETVP